METLLGNLQEIAIERIQEFAPIAESMNPNGYYVGFSGGKDSSCVLDLVKRSGVKYEAHYHLTTCDPPELVHFIKDNHSEVVIDKPPMTIWQLIRKKKMPPRRQARYCCEVLKEHGGAGCFTITGVRWGESARRSRRRMVESCFKDKTKRYLHPIIDWTDNDVWNYIKSKKLPYCSLYDEGFKRIGCVLCPMTRNTKQQIERWPKIAAAWEKAVKATYPTESKNFKFKSAQEYWEWWLDRDRPSLAKDSEEQILMFED